MPKLSQRSLASGRSETMPSNRMRAIWTFILAGVLAACSSSEQEQNIGSEHAVLVYFAYGGTDLQPMFSLEEKLEKAIADAQVGEFDGNEVAVDGSDATFFMYGPDANKLFSVVRPVLETASFMKGARVVLRYGSATEPDVRETEIILAP